MLNMMSSLSSCDELTLTHLEFSMLIMSLECLQLPTPNTKNYNSACVSNQRSIDLYPSSSFLKCVRHLEEYCVQMLLSKEELLQTLRTIKETHPFLCICRNKHLRTKILVAHTGYNDSEVYSALVSILVASNVGFQNYLANNLAKLYNSYINEVPSAEPQQYNEHLKVGVHHDSEETNQQVSQIYAPDVILNVESTIPYPTRIPAYDFDGRAINGDESIDTFFLADGAIARCQAYTIAEGNQSIIVSLIGKRTIVSSNLQWRKGHLEIDSAYSGEVNDLFPLPPNLLSGELHVSFNDDVFFSLSVFGPQANGNIPYIPAKPAVLENQLDPTSVASFVQPNLSPQKLSKKQQEQHVLEQQRLLEEQLCKQRQVANQQYQVRCRRMALNNKEQQLFVTTKKGLHISFQILHDYECLSAAVAVHQEYLCSQPFNKEKHRCFLPNGTLICYMKNGAIIIRCSDGTIFETASSFHEDMFQKQSRTDISLESSTSPPKESTILATGSICVPWKKSKTLWLVTTPLGKRYLWKGGYDLKDKSDKGISNTEGESSLMLQANTTSRALLLEPLKVFKTAYPASQEVRMTSRYFLHTL